MLVLSRKPNERIQIGPNITITIVNIQGGAVRIGIEAPRDVRVLRTELAERIAQEMTEPTTRMPQGGVGQSARSDDASTPQNSSPRFSQQHCRAPRAPSTPPVDRVGARGRQISGARLGR